MKKMLTIGLSATTFLLVVIAIGRAVLVLFFDIRNKLAVLQKFSSEPQVKELTKALSRSSAQLGAINRPHLQKLTAWAPALAAAQPAESIQLRVAAAEIGNLWGFKRPRGTNTHKCRYCASTDPMRV